MVLVYDSNKSLSVSSQTTSVKFCYKNYAVVHVRNFDLLFRHLKCQSLLLLLQNLNRNLMLPELEL